MVRLSVGWSEPNRRVVWNCVGKGPGGLIGRERSGRAWSVTSLDCVLTLLLRLMDLTDPLVWIGSLCSVRDVRESRVVAIVREEGGRVD